MPSNLRAEISKTNLDKIFENPAVEEVITVLVVFVIAFLLGAGLALAI